MGRYIFPATNLFGISIFELICAFRIRDFILNSISILLNNSNVDIAKMLIEKYHLLCIYCIYFWGKYYVYQ